jgi:hypothetical protein
MKFLICNPVYIYKMTDQLLLVDIFCKNPALITLQPITPIVRRVISNECFKVLSQKTGNQTKALDILILMEECETLHGYIISHQPEYKLTPLQSLTHIGVATIPIIPAKSLEKYQKGFLDSLRSFPEYSRHPDNPDLNSNGDPITYALGGFAALGNPASFHNEFVRKLRNKSLNKVSPLFKEYIDGFLDPNLRDGYRLELLFDRPMYRKAGQKAVAEAWHRDVMQSDMIEQRDEVFGGWVNLDSEDQYFSCIPGSHLGIVQKDIESGFDTMKASLTRDMKDPKKVKNAMDDVSKKRFRFRVPPGHIIVFPQYILHEVVASPVKHDMKRLFTAWRITTSTNPLMDYTDIMEKQRIVCLPGGMRPPVYAANHGSCFLGIPTVTALTKADKKKPTRYWVKDLMDTYKKLKVDLDGETDPIKATATYLKTVSTDIPLVIPTADQKIRLSSFKTNPSLKDSTTTLIKWSNDTFKTETLVTKSYKGADGMYKIVKRHMDGLADYGFPLYKKYSDSEKAKYAPHRLD